MVRHEIIYHDNYQIKCFREYVGNILIEEINYKDNAELISSSTWYENGNLKSEYNYIDGRLANEYHSINVGKQNKAYCRTWYENGQLESDTEFVDGKIHGLRRTWYENGTMARSVPYIDGVVKGIARSWLENGEFSSELEF